MPKSKETAITAAVEAVRARDLLQLSFSRSCRSTRCDDCVFSFVNNGTHHASVCWRAFCVAWVKGVFGRSKDCLGKDFDFQRHPKK
jgi:hypothetical protein